MLKFFVGTILIFSLFSPSTSSGGKSNLPDRVFDDYGNICWEDEKDRLDNFAIALQQDPELDGYIIVYAGRHSCAGEAQARGERAKKWVVKRGVEDDRVILKDGGYREEVTTILQPVVRGKDFPVAPTLEAHEVEVVTDCKDKIYKRAKCDEP